VARAKKSNSGFGTFFFGFVVALVLAAAAGFVYFRYEATPRAVADLPAPIRQVVAPPAQAAGSTQTAKPTPLSLSATSPVHSERAFKQPPFGISEDVFESGAKVYRQNCARCHGTPGRDAVAAAQQHAAPQLWKKHSHGDVVGVSDDPPGETFEKVTNGIPHTRMPAFGHRLTERQRWEVSLLLKNADQPLPDPVQGILTAGRP